MATVSLSVRFAFKRVVRSELSSFLSRFEVLSLSRQVYSPLLPWRKKKGTVSAKAWRFLVNEFAKDVTVEHDYLRKINTCSSFFFHFGAVTEGENVLFFRANYTAKGVSLGCLRSFCRARGIRLHVQAGKPWASVIHIQTSATI